MIASRSSRERASGAFAVLAAVAMLALAGSASAQKLFLDSRTGAITSERPADGGLALSASEADMLSTSSDDLVVKRSGAQGMSVNLQGRFRHMATATISPTGELSIDCASPKADGEAEQP